MDLQSLFSNPMLLQFLAAGGMDIASGNPFGQNLGAAVNQNISAQSFAKLLSKMMGGGQIPEGSKMTIDDKAVKFEAPRNVLGGTQTNTNLAMEGSNLPGGSGVDWRKLLNPFQ